MKFRSGKYKGVDVETVKRMAPWYIQWVRENRPEMLRAPKQAQPKPYKKPVYVDPPDIPVRIPSCAASFCDHLIPSVPAT